jgi:CheY-like chemotaxis protein
MHILIVDDDDDCRRIYRMALEHAGHTVLLAHDGLEGVQIVKAETPDLVLMDIAMPYLDGFSAISLLRKDVETQDMKIVAITAAAAHYELSAFLEKGFDGLLTKPVTPAELVEAVARLDRRGPKQGK